MLETIFVVVMTISSLATGQPPIGRLRQRISHCQPELILNAACSYRSHSLRRQARERCSRTEQRPSL
jgi:hypothetical protein